MTSPTQATTGDSGRYYHGSPRCPKRLYPSVTTVLDVLSKGDNIVMWAARLSAEYMAERINAEDSLPWPEVVAGWTKAAREAWRNTRDAAGDKGDMAHAWVAQFLSTNGAIVPPVPPAIKGHVKQFLEWYGEHDVVVLYVEATVYNDTYGYAGSCDIFAMVDGIPMVIDMKTSKSVYPTVALQAVAYARGEYIVTDCGLVASVPQVQKGAVLHIRPRSRKFLELDISDERFADFLRLLETKTKWLDEAAQKAILGPL